MTITFKNILELLCGIKVLEGDFPIPPNYNLRLLSKLLLFEGSVVRRIKAD